MTPIAVVQLSCQRLLRDRSAVVAPRQVEVVGAMAAACSRLAGELSRLIEHVRLAAGRPETSRHPLRLDEIAARVVEGVRARAERKGLVMRMRGEPALPACFSDGPLVTRVLEELVSNAVKFTDAGSVTVALEHHAGEHRVSVRDSGPGIPLADRHRIFEPFTCVGSLRNKHLPGLGLGLSNVRELVGALGGQISVAPNEPRGAVFTVVLPDASPAADRACI
jgi:signal transduction histidine kinase